MVPDVVKLHFCRYMKCNLVYLAFFQPECHLPISLHFSNAIIEVYNDDPVRTSES